MDSEELKARYAKLDEEYAKLDIKHERFDRALNVVMWALAAVTIPIILVGSVAFVLKVTG